MFSAPAAPWLIGLTVPAAMRCRRVVCDRAIHGGVRQRGAGLEAGRGGGASCQELGGGAAGAWQGWGCREAAVRALRRSVGPSLGPSNERRRACACSKLCINHGRTLSSPQQSLDDRLWPLPPALPLLPCRWATWCGPSSAATCPPHPSCWPAWAPRWCCWWGTAQLWPLSRPRWVLRGRRCLRH